MVGNLIWLLISIFGINLVSSRNSVASRKLASSSSSPIEENSDYTYSSELTIFFDPPNGTSSPTALGVYVWTNQPTAVVYYDDLANSPTFNSSQLTTTSPYFMLTTQFKGSRLRVALLIATFTDPKGNQYRSNVVTLHYYVESSSRPNSYGYFIPGIESNGYFIQVKLEESAAARPQSSTTQEFADFFSSLGVGTYTSQIEYIRLTDIDPDLQGFEGGFTCK
jgi:hypothetical protein